MCGIAGFIRPHAPLAFRRFRAVSERLQHRGPDDEGFLLGAASGEISEAWAARYKPQGWPSTATEPESLLENDYTFGLLHRRLAIIAPDASGHQPMGLGHLWLSFNGEIYNYQSLRKELEVLGHQFHTQGDTEVLLHAWQQWGEKCLPKLDGMWTFALIDTERKFLFAACDGTGIKPLYYRRSSRGLEFASEPKAFRELEGELSPNPAAVSRFLAYGLSDESGETMFRELQRLEGGTCLQIGLDGEGFSLRRWNPSFRNQPERKAQNESDLVEEIRSTLLKMIRLRLQADVPLGVCLSGGIDSSTIAGLVAAVSGNAGQRKAFMAVLPPGSQPDESPFARLMAERAGFDFHTICPDAEGVASDLENLIYTLDEPPPGLNAYSQYRVFQKVSEEGVRVSLDGQGADELFGGYPRHRESAWMERPWHEPALEKELLQHGLQALVPAEVWAQLLRRQKPEYGIFTTEIWSKAGRYVRFGSSLNQQLEQEFTSSSLPFLLKAADRNSMRWSVESRMPFADYPRLIRKVFSLPSEWKIREGQTKYLLRQAAREWVPAGILERKDKVGFAAPNVAWLQAALRQQRLYWDSAQNEHPWINGKEFHRQALRFLDNPVGMDPSVLWRALALQIWLRGWSL